MQRIAILTGITLLACASCQKNQGTSQPTQNGGSGQQYQGQGQGQPYGGPQGPYGQGPQGPQGPLGPQGQPGPFGGQPQQGPYAQQQSSQSIFESKNIKSYSGQIVRVIDINDPSGAGDLVGILVQTDKGTIPVILGPRCFVGGGQNLSQGQQVEVTGAEVYREGSVIVIALEATVNGSTIQLRERDGTPLWSAWKKK